MVCSCTSSPCGPIPLYIILHLILLCHIATGHPPPPPPPASPVGPQVVQCRARCMAKCLADKKMEECKKNCREYQQPTLCGPIEDSERKKRGIKHKSDSNSDEHHPPLPLKNAECWKKCRDLGPKENGPPLPPPRDVHASITENFSLDINWQPGPGPEGEKVRLYLIQIEKDIPYHQTLQIYSQELKYSGVPSSSDIFCGSITIMVAAVNAAKGIGHFSKPVELKAEGPRIPTRMELYSAKFNATPFVADEYEANGTLNVELEFHFDGWPFGIEDLEVSPVFHMVSCGEPDLSQAVPAADFHHGTKPNTIMTHLGADLMYRRCRFVYAVDEVRSTKCEREFSYAGKPPNPSDYQSVIFNCSSVEDSHLAGGACISWPKPQTPICGQFDVLNYTILDQSENGDENTVSVNIQFEPFSRVLARNPKYYLALYGNAQLFSGVNMTNVLGKMTNCAEFATDKSCKRFSSNQNDTIMLDGLKWKTKYGVILCAILDPKNWEIPFLNSTDKSSWPRAFGLYLQKEYPHKSSRLGWDSHETEEEEERKERIKVEEVKKKGLVRTIMVGAALLFLFLISVVLAIFFWFYRQKKQLMKKKLDFEAMRREREQQGRYTDFPSRREDPWELERRNLIIYEDRKLGSGAFGSVYLGKLVGINRLKNAGNNLSIGLLRADNALVAVKMLPEYADTLSKSEFLREIGLMKTLGYHERLVNMLACLTQSEPYCLIVEYCSDGDLLQFLRHRCKYMLELDDLGVNYSDPDCDADFDRSMIMTVKQLLMFAVQISYGLEYLTQKGFVHRDVAARNILVHDRTHAKIGDFGLCRFIYADSSNYKGRGGRLPVKWMSPEAIRHYEFTTSSDVWSFGVLMFEIITLGGTPYPGIQPDDMLAFLESGKRITQPDNCPNEYYAVMCSCWAGDPRRRPDFALIRQQLALQLENVTDEYSYLKLDAKKDYYNVSYGELKAQRGENVEAELGEERKEEEGEEEKEEEKEMPEEMKMDEEEEMGRIRRRRNDGDQQHQMDDINVDDHRENEAGIKLPPSLVVPA